MRKFGEIMAELRQDRGMTQKDLARRMHLASSSISNYETGQRTPDADFICRLADELNVTADYLLGRSDVNISPDNLHKSYCDKLTVAQLLEMLLSLDDERRKALMLLLDDMCLCSRLNKR